MGRRVAYIFDPNVGNYYYGRGHPMKPQRISLTHEIVFSYDLQEKMKIFSPDKATPEALRLFHLDEYISFLQGLPCSMDALNNGHSKRYNVGDDCPYFDGLFDFCRSYTGASLEGAGKLNSQEFDVAINWSGGLHHAKKGSASGFCYVNDIVLSILELLRYHPRVLYIDIDVHHGDGVQEAFFCSNRVFTLSFHNFDGRYFPGTGNIGEIGTGEGLNFCLNVPLRSGIDDESYLYVFKPIVSDTISHFQPSCIVLQCGSDSLAGDRLGCFNMSIKGHGSCVQHVKSFNIPLLVLGGGGYSISNVARCWAYETSLLVDAIVEDKIPETSRYYDYYRPDYSLHPNIETSIMNQNSKSLLDALIVRSKIQLKRIEGCPSVQMKPIISFFKRLNLFQLSFDSTSDPPV